MTPGRRLLTALVLLGCVQGRGDPASSQDSTHVELVESSVLASASPVSATFALDVRLRVAPGDTIVLHLCQGSLRYRVASLEEDGSVGDPLQPGSYCPLSYVGAEEMVGPAVGEYSVSVAVPLGEASPWFIARSDLEGPLTMVLAGESREMLATPPFQLRFRD